MQPADVLNNVFTEQEERTRRQNNIIVYELPEFNKETPTNDQDKFLFFKDLTEFNQQSIKKLLNTLDPEIYQPVYTKRIGRYQNDKIRPLLLSFDSQVPIKSIQILI